MFAMARPLNTYREDRYMTVREFADFLGISLHTFYKIIRGEHPRFTTMRRIAEKLDVHPSDITEFVRKPDQS
jgi:DNA-binding Xre family transcriptional regulator